MIDKERLALLVVICFLTFVGFIAWLIIQMKTLFLILNEQNDKLLDILLYLNP